VEQTLFTFTTRKAKHHDDAELSAAAAATAFVHVGGSGDGVNARRSNSR
jgi:hypothetical protein